LKTLPDAIIAGKSGGSERVILVRIVPHANDTWGDLLWATKDITITDWEGGGTMKTFKGGVLKEGQLGTISQAVDIEEGGNVAKVSDLTFKIVNPEYSDTNRFDETFTDNLENRTVEFYLAFWTGSNLAWSDILLLHEFVVDDVRFDHNEYTIKVKDAGFKRHKIIPDLIITEDAYAHVPQKNLGSVVPLLYGTLQTGNRTYGSRFAPPIMLIDEQKYKWIYSRNKGMSINTGYLLLYFGSENCWIEFLPTAGYTITYGRPTTIEFASLTQNILGSYIAQLRGQGKNTNPSSLDFSNVIDSSDTSYLTLGANEKLYLKVVMPSGFARVSDETELILFVVFGAISGTGSIKYYNPEYDAGVGALSDGITFNGGDANSTKQYVFGSDKTAHGHEDDQNDKQNLWNLEELGVLEFGIEVDAASSANIINVHLGGGALLMRGSLDMIVSGKPGSRRWYVKPTGYQDMDLLKDKEGFCASGFGTPFGAWIDQDSRDNGWDENQGMGNIYILESILRDELGLDSTQIDYESFDTLGDDITGERKLWQFAGIVDKTENSLNVIQKFCRQASIIYFQNYENREKVTTLKKQTASKTIDRTTIQQDTINVRFSGLNHVYNEFYINYKKQWANDSFTKTLFITASDHNLSSNSRSGTPNTYTGLCSDSQSKYLKTNRLTLDCDWIRDDATAELLIKWLAEWLCYRKYIVEFETDGLDHIDLELGVQAKIDYTLLPDGVSNDASFLLFDIKHNLNKDRMTFQFMQVPDLLP